MCVLLTHVHICVSRVFKVLLWPLCWELIEMRQMATQGVQFVVFIQVRDEGDLDHGNNSVEDGEKCPVHAYNWRRWWIGARVRKRIIKMTLGALFKQ